MNSFASFMILTVKALVAIAIILIIMSLFAIGGSNQSARDKFYRQCVVENKELPRPDLFCNTSWDQLRKGEK